MADGHHAVGARRIVVAGSADESAHKLGQHRVGGGVDDVDRFIGAIAEDLNPDGGINKADVEGQNLLAARQRDHGNGREGFVGAHRGSRREQRGHKSERKTDQRSMIAASLNFVSALLLKRSKCYAVVLGPVNQTMP